MTRLFQLKRTPAAILYLIGVFVCVGVGIGMPFFCIGLGSLVGWYIARRELLRTKSLVRVLRRTTRAAVGTSLCTFLMMVVIWGPRVGSAVVLRATLESVGFPTPLLGSRTSPTGLMLMILISPCLQLMTTVVVSRLTILRCLITYEAAARKAKLPVLTLRRLSVDEARRAG